MQRDFQIPSSLSWMKYLFIRSRKVANSIVLKQDYRFEVGRERYAVKLYAFLPYVILLWYAVRVI